MTTSNLIDQWNETCAVVADWEKSVGIALLRAEEFYKQSFEAIEEMPDMLREWGIENGLTNENLSRMKVIGSKFLLPGGAE